MDSQWMLQRFGELAQLREAVCQRWYVSAVQMCLKLQECVRCKHASLVEVDAEALLQELGEGTYMLALTLCQASEGAAAEKLLAQLGCKYKLAPQVFQRSMSRKPLALSGAPCSTDRVCTYPGAISGASYEMLANTLQPQAAYWGAHGYHDTSTPFFSYLYQLANAPQTAIEAAIQQLHAVLQTSCHQNMMRSVASAEWWAHCRDVEGCHQLHFDVKEAALRQGLHSYHLEHPVISSVLYLTDEGGPTLVLDQTPADPLADKGWLAWPCPNQLLAFPGNLLHGVLPGEALASMAISKKRITLIVAWWPKGMRAEPGAPGTGPCREGPHLGAELYSPEAANGAATAEHAAYASQHAKLQPEMKPPQAGTVAVDTAQSVPLQQAAEGARPAVDGMQQAHLQQAVQETQAVNATQLANLQHAGIGRATEQGAQAVDALQQAEQDIQAEKAKPQANIQLNRSHNSGLTALLQHADASNQQRTDSIPLKQPSASQCSRSPTQASAQRKCESKLHNRCSPAVMVAPVWECINASCSVENCSTAGEPMAKRQKVDTSSLQSVAEEMHQQQLSSGGCIAKSGNRLEDGQGVEPKFVGMSVVQSPDTGPGGASNESCSYSTDSQASGSDCNSNSIDSQSSSADSASADRKVGDGQCQLLPIPPLRFFLRSADEIIRTYLPPSAGLDA